MRAHRTAALALALALAGCGGGGGGSDQVFELPRGSQFDTVASERVLVVVEARNECEKSGTCASPALAATPAPGACDVGSGNTRGLAVYRLGASGLLLDDPSRPGTPDDPEQVVATADNPRRLLTHPNDPSLLYVATNKRIQVFRLAAAGATRCIAQTSSDAELDPAVDTDVDPVDLAIDPTVGNGVLYVAARGASRIDAYAIAADGTVPASPTSCVVGGSFEEFSAVTPLTDGFLAAGGHSRIEVYARADGQFPPATPAPSATPSPGPSPGLECVGVRPITEPVSSISGAIVTHLLFEPSLAAPIGQLFVTEEVSRRAFTFPIDAAGTIDDTDSSRTKRAGLYQRMLRHDAGTSAILYISVFQEGRVDALSLQNGLLPDHSFSRTAEDPFTLPVGLAIDEERDDLLYVAQGGRGRIDGFRIASDGGLEALPATSTRPIVTATGQSLDTFPDDVAIVPLPR